MKDDDRSKRLMKAALELLDESDDVDKITTRSIAERADVNLALINYYYGSKDELMKAAINEIINESSSDMYGYGNLDSPKEIIINFIIGISRDLIKYEKYSKLYIPDLLLKDRISIPDKILPYVIDYYHNERTLSECRLIAYQITSVFQLIFYRCDEVNRYTGMNLREDSEREKVIRETVGSFLR